MNFRNRTCEDDYKNEQTSGIIDKLEFKLLKLIITIREGKEIMGIFLEKIEVENYRGLENYSIEGLLNWSSITGSNSAGKSTLINAILLLGSNKTHTTSDIPAYFKPTKVSPTEVSVKVSYLFKLTSGFLDMMSDERVVEVLILSYQEILGNRPEINNDSYKSTLKMELGRLKSKPLKEIFIEGLYSTINDFKKYNNPSLYNAFLDPTGVCLRPIDDVLKEAKYLHVELELSLGEGPRFNFFLLNDEKQQIVSDDLFANCLLKTQSIDPIFFAFAIGAVFIKGVTNPPFHKEEGAIPPSILSSDGSNLEEFIEYCLACGHDRIALVSDLFKKMFKQSIEIKKPKAGSHSEETKIVVKLGKSGDWFPLEKLSDGMHHALRILFQLESCCKGDILIIDEPELHLHPSAARSLRATLLNRKTEVQIICATHSPLFIDPSCIDTVLLHKTGEAPRMLQATDIDPALVELGSSGLDALMYDVVIWYEGPADKYYIEKWLQLLSEEEEIEAKISDIGLIHFGGKGHLGYIDPKAIKKIARKSLFIVDSDKKNPTDSLDNTTKEFSEKCNRTGIPCWITTRRAIENYIPAKVLRETFSISDDSFQVKPYENVLKILQANERGIRKTSLARSVASKITLNDLKTDTEFYGELKKEIIDALNSFVSS